MVASRTLCVCTQCLVGKHSYGNRMHLLKCRVAVYAFLSYKAPDVAEGQLVNHRTAQRLKHLLTMQVQTECKMRSTGTSCIRVMDSGRAYIYM